MSIRNIKNEQNGIDRKKKKKKKKKEKRKLSENS